MLLDLKLPRASGFEVLEWIRQRPEWMALPIIILTSSINGADMKRAYDLGANFFVSKPVKFEDLVQTIKDLGAYGLSDSFLSVPGPFAVPAAPRGASRAQRLSES
jgi:CheY-like chemotaxis protein